MTAVDPTNYPFNVDSDGWPEPVYTAPYPHQYYYDNGQNSDEIKPTFDQTSVISNNNHHHHHHHHRHQPKKTKQAIPLVIRRHAPGTTDPLKQLTPRNDESIPNNQVTFTHEIPQSLLYTIPVENPIYVPVDSDERPIKPMKDTYVYHNPTPLAKKVIQPKTPVSQPKPTQPTPRPVQSPARSVQSPARSIQSPPKPVQSPPKITQIPRKPVRTTPKSVQALPYLDSADTFYSPPPAPSSVLQADNEDPSRRPIRTDLIPRASYGILERPQRSRQVIIEDPIEEIEDDDGDYDDSIIYVKQVPKKVISYRPVREITTREVENYQTSRNRLVVRSRPPIVKTTIYR